jgi:hypothetical protein
MAYLTAAVCVFPESVFAGAGDAAEGVDVTDMLTGEAPAVTVGLARRSAPVPDQILDQVMATSPAERGERLQRFTVRADIERGALADVLARVLLGARLALPPQRVILLRNALGAAVVVNTRPDGRTTRLSMAHFGCWVACSVSDGPTGVDVEFRRGLSTPVLAACRSGAPLRRSFQLIRTISNELFSDHPDAESEQEEVVGWLAERADLPIPQDRWPLYDFTLHVGTSVRTPFTFSC